MAGIIVYIPGSARADRQSLISAGLGELLDPAVDPAYLNTVKGPDGSHGVLVAFCGAIPLPPPAYDAETQEWLEAPPDGELAKGRYWLGYVKTAKPSADVLQRSELIDGEPIRLADGNNWIVPCAEYAPKRLTRDRDTGDEARIVTDAHRLWVKWSNEIYRWFTSTGFQAAVEANRAVTIPNGFRYAALTLSKNYRVNIDVLDLLGLVEDFEAFQIARVATGMTIIERLVAQKKTTESPSQLALSK